MKEMSICCPSIYYTESMQQFINNSCRHEDKKWIYEIIKGANLDEREEIYINNKDWMLCKDVHQGSDFRMLVIFKDESLRTIRDLRKYHVKMLLDVKNEVCNFINIRQLKTTEEKCYSIYFHYTPSVYQLHAHVCVPGQYYNSSRSHNISHVIKNLLRDSLWYRDALILCSMNKAIKQLNLYKTIFVDDGQKIRTIHHCTSEHASASKIKPSEKKNKIGNYDSL